MATGYSKMPMIVQHAMPDIRAHLWSLYWLVRMASVKKVNNSPTVVELGVRAGDSTRALLAGCQDTYGELTSYDIDGDAYHVRDVTEKCGIPWFTGCTEWNCIASDSAKAAGAWPPLSVDILFVDTDHSLETTRREIQAWHVKMSAGGVMVFHDTGLNEPGRDGVAQACREFSDEAPGWEFENNPHSADGDTGLGILWKGR